MSAATVEKPAAPLGSFITKLTPTEKPVEKSVESKKVEEKPIEKPVEKPAAEPVTELKKEEPQVKTETKETEKPKDTEILDKRLKDTQRWGNEEHKARLDAERKAKELRAQLERIEKKLDGTFVEPTGPSTDQIVANADLNARIRASHHAALRQYGDKFVMETVWNADSPYQELQANNPRLLARVLEADDPVLEAIAVVKEHQDGQKYGRTPEEIRKKLEAELTPKLKQDILDGLKVKPGPATNTLGNVRGGTERTEQKSEAPMRLDFRQVFPWGASRT